MAGIRTERSDLLGESWGRNIDVQVSKTHNLHVTMDSWWYPKFHWINNLTMTRYWSLEPVKHLTKELTLLPRLFRGRILPVHRWNRKRWFAWSQQLTTTVVLYFLIRISALHLNLLGCGCFARSLASRRKTTRRPLTCIHLNEDYL